MAADARRLAAIMFTDMVGYSALAQADEHAALQLLDRHNRILRPIFTRHHGREVKTVGDAFLIEFDSTLDAVQCAIEVQSSLHDYNLASPDGWKIRIRVGIHVGDVVRSEGDILGDAVNIASRIQALAEPEGISLTQQVYDQVRNKVPTPFQKLPPRGLKNIKDAVTVYRVVRPWRGEEARAGSDETSPSRHLAVLPLSNISPDPSDAYFADGLTEELITVLSRVSGLTVIARTSVIPYKAQPKSVAEVGADLGVGSVLEGSVRKAGTRLRITLQLVSVASQRPIWAESYDREMGDVFSVQTDVAERTAKALRVQLAEQEPGPRQPTNDPDAYEEYLRGLAAVAAEGMRDIRDAFAHFERAVEKDPEFAEAYAAWANALVASAGDIRPMTETIPPARKLVEKALALNPDSAEAHAALANILFQSDNDWPAAEQEFRRAIALNPSHLPAHRFLGMMLAAIGRYAEAEEVLRQALRLDPAGGHRASLGLAQLYGTNPDGGVEVLRQMVEERPTSGPSHVALGFFLAHAGRVEEAQKEADFPVAPDADDASRFDHALLSAMVGRPAEGRDWIATRASNTGTQYISGTDLAMLHSALGDKEEALRLLKREYEAGERLLWLYHPGSWFDPIRDDPRYVELLRRYRLPLEKPRRVRVAAEKLASSNSR